MRTVQLRVALLVVVACCCAAAGDDSAGARIRPIYEVLEHELPDLHDGSVADWKRLLPSPTLVSSDFVRSRPEEPMTLPTLPDLDVSVYLAWTRSGKVYAGFEVLDDSNHMPSRGWPGGIGGCFVGVDGDASGGQYMGYLHDELGCEDWGTPECQHTLVEMMRQAQTYLVTVAPVSGVEIEIMKERSWVLEPEYTVAHGASVDEGPPGWVLEMMVTPFDDLRPGGEGFWGKQSDSVVSTLVDGVQVGISIQVFDWDLENEEGEPSWWSLDHPTPGPGPPFESDGFSVFELLPAEARPTVASPATWGQAKRACAP